MKLHRPIDDGSTMAPEAKFNMPLDISPRVRHENGLHRSGSDYQKSMRPR
jgi:hypothetical protein